MQRGITLLLEDGLPHTGAATTDNSCSLFSGLQPCVKHPLDKYAPLPAGQPKLDSKMHRMALFEAGCKGNTLEKKATTQLKCSVSFN